MNDLPIEGFENGARVKVRRLKGEFLVHSSRLVNKIRRYSLEAIDGTGCLLEQTEAFAGDMELVPAPEPAPELALAPDPPAANSAPQERSDSSPDAAAPAGERSAADAIRSPGAGITLNEDGSELEGDDESFALPPGEIDHTDDPEMQDFREAFGQPETSKLTREQVLPRKKLRPPADSIFYHQLKDIMYSGRFAIMDDADDEALNALDTNTPVGVAATRERNGSAVWIIVADGRLRKAILETFYPTEAHEESRAIEHAVMLALREVPIRTPDLEVLLLQL